jgi:hypothetical protein
MNNIPYTGLVLTLIICAPAAANDSDTRSSSPTPREMVHCMMARVKASANESYKSAFKACREQFEAASNEKRQVDINAMNLDAGNSPKN